MKTLCLLRHAQSSRRIDLQDFDRPLSRDGFDAAHRMAEVLITKDLMPERVLCSAARRARETWAALASHVDPGARDGITVDEREDLYLSSSTRLLIALRALPEGTRKVLVVAHNPGLHRLARELVGAGSRPGAVEALDRGYPPAALAVLSVAAGSWSELAPDGARLERFVLPSGPAQGS